jgi:hypothetical protein
MRAHRRRLTSNMFPWCTEYELAQLPDYAAIADELAFAGKLARAYGQRLTFHPSHFVKLGAAEGTPLLARSMKELEVHSQVRGARRSLHPPACCLLPIAFAQHPMHSTSIVTGCMFAASSHVCLESSAAGSAHASK